MSVGANFRTELIPSFPVIILDPRSLAGMLIPLVALRCQTYVTPWKFQLELCTLDPSISWGLNSRSRLTQIAAVRIPHWSRMT